jgi:hypothetical protein
VVPEPSTVVLLGAVAGLLGVWPGLRWRVGHSWATRPTSPKRAAGLAQLAIRERVSLDRRGRPRTTRRWRPRATSRASPSLSAGSSSRWASRISVLADAAFGSAPGEPGRASTTHVARRRIPRRPPRPGVRPSAAHDTPPGALGIEATGADAPMTPRVAGGRGRGGRGS